ncbi:MAG: amidohydrolase [Ignavibacteriaceae bacterium]|nr:amidohydrolase [Ignavibacteriaceae bacterium]
MKVISDPVELRHTLHRNPELMFEEFKTTELLIKNIEGMNNLKILRPLKTGLIVDYKVNDGDYYLFRADIDALPIKEETGAPFASINNSMHACGHDIHTSILYGFLKQVVKNRINRNILFLFQPGEEGGGGAEKIINSGILNDYKIKKAFALHVTDEYEQGVIASTPGILFASAFELDIEFFGTSAHVAFPENGKNAFEALIKFLTKVNTLINEQSEKIIFGYGKITSGDVRNIIPGYAKIEATLRTLSRKKSEAFISKIISLLGTIERDSGIKYKLTRGTLYTEVDVDKKLYEKCKEALEDKFNFTDCGYKMTGEDFGFISKLYPSFMFWLGTRIDEQYGLHNPKFLPDDSIINKGIDIFNVILSEV